MVFEIFMMVGWTLFGIMLLYLWADVRELKQDFKTYRRDLMRNSIGGRTSEGYTGFSEEEYWKEVKEEEPFEIQPVQEEPVKSEKKRGVSLKPGEEQVVREILTEFLN